MQIAILSARSGWHTDELCRALAERGHIGCVLPYDGLVAHFPDVKASGLRPKAQGLSQENVLTPETGLRPEAWALGPSGRISLLHADAVLARIIPNGSLEQIIYRVDALHWLERRGIRVINSPRAIERSVDKFYATALIAEAGLPTPETVVCEGVAAAMDAIERMLRGPDLVRSDSPQPAVIIKPLFGSMGNGLVRVTDPDVAYRVLRTLEHGRPVFYLQRAVAHDGRDVRAFVIGGRVAGAIERRARAGEWRTNVSRGGAPRPFDLPPAWAELAVAAAAAMGADYAGVDLLPAADGGVYVLEVNGIPGWRGLQQATGVDVAGTIVEHLVATLRAGVAEA